MYTNSISKEGAEDLSVLHYVQHTQGIERFLYALHAIFGIVFYGMAIFTFLGLIIYWINGRGFFSFGTVIFSCYVLINGIVGYGFIFHKRWLITIFGFVCAIMSGTALLLWLNEVLVQQTLLFINIPILFGILSFLIVTKRVLTGKYASVSVLISFIASLLISFLLTNVGMLQ